MNRKTYFVMVVLFAMIFGTQAQNETDAFRYSLDAPFGTARFTSLAGSMGAYGADFSVLASVNPAAIGLYKRQEFTLTPMLSYNGITSTYNQTGVRTNKYSFALSNIAYVGVFNTRNSKWKSWQLATGYNQLADYNGKMTVKGENSGNNGSSVTSIFDYYANQATQAGLDYSQLDRNENLIGMAWYHWLIDTVAGNSLQYRSAVTDTNNQKQSLMTEGSKGEYVFSVGANYDDKLFLGATLGIPFFNYKQLRTYSEGKTSGFDSLAFIDNFSTKATGVNFKLGVIYQPISFLRLGVNIHTPTYYGNIKENYEQYFDIYNAKGIDSNDYSYESTGNFNYNLVSPFKVGVSAAFIFKNIGFLNVDYELSDYSTMQFESRYNDYDFEIENQNINTYFRPTSTVRVGVEVNANPFVFRLGYSYMSNPYAESVEKDGSRHIFAGGIGFKTKNFFFDFAYSYRLYNDKGVFYDAEQVNPYTNQYRNQYFSLTFGWKIGSLGSLGS